MPSLKQTDPVAYGIAHARKADIERIALRVGCPEGKVRSWRHGTLDLADWVAVEIARVLRLDDTVLKQHRERRRRRHDQDVAAQRQLEEAAA